MGAPNCSRTLAYSTAVVRHHCATPAASAAASATRTRRTRSASTPVELDDWSAACATCTRPPRRVRSKPTSGVASQPSAATRTHESVVRRREQPACVDDIQRRHRDRRGLPRSRHATVPRRATAARAPSASAASTSSRAADVEALDDLADQDRAQQRPGRHRVRGRLDGDHLVEQVAAAAAVLLGDADARQPGFDHGLPRRGERCLSRRFRRPAPRICRRDHRPRHVGWCSIRGGHA